MHLVRMKTWSLWLLVVLTAKTAAETSAHLKTLDEELLENAEAKIELHKALGHTHPSMTNSLLQNQEMEQILHDREYRSVGGDRGDGKGDEKDGKSPKGPANSAPASSPASAASETSGPKGSKANSGSNEPKTLGSGDDESKGSKRSKGESGGDAVEDEEDTDGNEEEDLPVNEGDEAAEEEVEDGDEEPATSEEEAETEVSSNVTEVDQEEVFFEHTIERTLGISAFLYEMPDNTVPTSNDYLELLLITDSIFRDIFDWFFGEVSDVVYGSTKVTDCKALTPLLVQCDVTLYFSDEGYLPTTEQLEEIAAQELKEGKNFHQLYLERLHGSETQAFAKTTKVRYISTQDDLDTTLMAEHANMAAKNTQEDASSISSYVVPIVVVGFLLLLVGCSFVYRRHQLKKNGHRVLDPKENIMKHKEERDVEDGTTAGDTYRTNAFSEDGAISAYQDFRARSKQKNTKENLDKQMEQMIHELEEVSLASSTSRMSAKNSMDSDDDSASSMTPAEQRNKTMTVVLDDSCKPAWAKRGSTTQSVVSQDSSSGWTSKAGSESSAAPSVSVKSGVMKYGNSACFQVPESSEFVATASPTIADKVVTPKEDTPSPVPSREIAGDFSFKTKEALSLPVLQDDEQSNSVSDNDLMVDVSSAMVLASDELQRKHTIEESPVLVTEQSFAQVVSNKEENQLVPLAEAPKTDSDAEIPAWLGAKPKISGPSTTALVSKEETDGKPGWANPRLKSVSKPTTTGNQAGSGEPSPNSSPQPEWMLKFKQMGLDKQQD